MCIHTPFPVTSLREIATLLSARHCIHLKNNDETYCAFGRLELSVLNLI